MAHAHLHSVDIVQYVGKDRVASTEPLNAQEYWSQRNIWRQWARLMYQCDRKGIQAGTHMHCHKALLETETFPGRSQHLPST